MLILMRWLTKLNGLFEKKEKPQPNNQIEKISFEILCEKARHKIKELNSAEERLKEELANRISLFDKELQPIMEKLEAFDLSNRKENEKLKFIVEQNKKVYLSHLKNLIIGLKKIKPLNIKDYMDKIENVINSFVNLSRMPFEKTTLLIGKEAESARFSFKNFVSDVRLVLSSNNVLFDKKDAGEKFITSLKEIKTGEHFHGELSLEMNRMNEMKENTSSEQSKIIQDIQNIMQNEEYQQDSKIKQGYITANASIAREIQLIKEKIPWKELSKMYHSDNKKMGLVKKYRENFTRALEEDTELQMNLLLQELNFSGNISLKELQIKINKMYNPIVLLTYEKISLLEKKSREIELELSALSAEQENCQKKINKLSLKKDTLVKQATDTAQLFI